MFARNTQYSPPVAVVDPFCGSGSVGLAARALGCSFFGMDKDNSCSLAVKALMENTTLLGRFAEGKEILELKKIKQKKSKGGGDDDKDGENPDDSDYGEGDDEEEEEEDEEEEENEEELGEV